MSGREKGGKGDAKRHRKVLRDNIQGISKPAIRRLARRGCVKRISGLVHEEIRGVLKVFLENTIRDAVTYTEHARRKTVTAVDVVHALRKQNRALYGFGGFVQQNVGPTRRKITDGGRQNAQNARNAQIIQNILTNTEGEERLARELMSGNNTRIRIERDLDGRYIPLSPYDLSKLRPRTYLSDNIIDAHSYWLGRLDIRTRGRVQNWYISTHWYDKIIGRGRDIPRGDIGMSEHDRNANFKEAVGLVGYRKLGSASTRETYFNSNKYLLP